MKIFDTIMIILKNVLYTYATGWSKEIPRIMDQIPIFSGGKFNLDSWLTCGQYLSLIEDHATKNDLIEAEIKELCLSRLSESALELFQKHQDSSWIELKNSNTMPTMRWP